jgi:hypothetical protein
MATITTTKQQTPSKPQAAASSVTAAEQVLADLEAQRENLAAERLKDDAEMGRVSFQAHALHELGASRTLSEITERAIGRDQRLRSLDLAIVEAGERLKASQAIEAKAQAKEVAAELLKRATRLVQHGQSLDDANAIRVEASRAISEELQQMRSLAHGLGVHVPSHEQFLAMGSRADLTATMHVPWARDVGEHLPPNERRTHTSYVMPWSDAITKAARAIMGEGKREAA